jgi:hypothetical protein
MDNVQTCDNYISSTGSKWMKVKVYIREAKTEWLRGGNGTIKLELPIKQV